MLATVLTLLTSPLYCFAEKRLEGPVLLELRWPEHRGNRAEPLLTVGEPGEGEVFFVQYEPDGRIRFGWEHVGAGAVYSEPVAVAPGPAHRVLLMSGGVLPAGEATLYQEHPALLLLRETTLVQYQGQWVLRIQTLHRPLLDGRMSIGTNRVGGSIAGARFRGEMLNVSSVGWERVLRESLQLTRYLKPAGGTGYPGAIKLRARFPKRYLGRAEPLIVTGVTGAGDLLYVVYEDEKHVRFGLDHWSVGERRSELVEVDYDDVQELEITLTSLLGPDSSERRTENRVVLNGKEVLLWDQRLHPSALEDIIVGANLIGGSTCDPMFQGQIFGISAASEAEFTPRGQR